MRTRASLTKPSAPMLAAITAWERPARTSLIASLVALYGTCTMSIPARPAKYAIERCVALPLPTVQVVELSRIGPGVVDEFPHRPHGQRRANHQHVFHGADVRDAREVPDRIVRQLRIERAVDRVACRR